MWRLLRQSHLEAWDVAFGVINFDHLVKVLSDFCAILLPFILWWLEYLKGNTWRFCKYNMYPVPSLTLPPSPAWAAVDVFIWFSFYYEGRKWCISSLTPSFLLTFVSCHFTVRKSFFFFFHLYIHLLLSAWNCGVSIRCIIQYVSILIYLDAQIVPNLASWVQGGSCTSMTCPLHFFRVLLFWNRWPSLFSQCTLAVGAPALSHSR